MSTRQKALDALADIEHQASGGLEIDSALFRTVRAALSAPAEQDGWQLVPVEPTEAMWSAGRDPVMFRELKHYRPASLPVPAWQRNPDGTVEKDTSKGTTAVHVWRAMLAAAPRPAPAEPQSCSLGCTTECKAKMHGCASECPALPWQPPAPAEPQPAAQQEQAIEHCLWARNGHTRCPQQERKPLTDEQIDRHSIAAADCPPSSTVILVSSLRRLLSITATKGDSHD